MLKTVEINVDKANNIISHKSGSIRSRLGFYIHLSNKYLSVSYVPGSLLGAGIQQ